MNNLDRYSLEHAELPMILMGSTAMSQQFEIVCRDMETGTRRLAEKGVDVTTIKVLTYNDASPDTQNEFADWAADAVRTARSEGLKHYE